MAKKFTAIWAVALFIVSSVDLAVAQSVPASGYGPSSAGTRPSAVCGDSGHALAWNGTAYTCQAITGGSASAGGSNTQLQYNNGGAIDGITGATTNGTVVTLTSPVLVTPALGTPASGVGTNLTGVPIATGVSGMGTGVGTFLATPSSANLAGALTNETGSGAAVFGTSPTLVTPILGTPTSGTATNLTGLPLTTGVTGTLPVANGGTGITSLGTGVATALGTNVSGTGAICLASGSSCAGGGGTPGGSTTQVQYNNAGAFGGITGATTNGTVMTLTSPVLVTPALGTPASGTLTNATGLPVSTGISGLGTGVATALGTAVSGTGAVCLASGSACGSGNTTISPTSGNTADNAVCMSNTTTTIKDCGYAITPSDVLPQSGNFTLTAAQWLNQDPIQMTATGTETFPAVSTLSADGIQMLQNASASAVITIQPNAADAVCITGSACGSTGASAALTAGYGAWITVATNKLYVTPIPYVGSGSASLTVGSTSIAGGTSGRVLYDNAGVLGELTNTGTGNNVLATSPTLVTPALGTPSSGVATNITGLPLTTGVTGTLPVANGGTGITALGTGVATALGVNVGSAGAPVVNGGALGTPSSGTATNLTGLPVSTGISGLGTGVATALATNVSGTGAICLASGSACSGAGSNITIGTTTVTSGTNTHVLYNNSGVAGEYTVSGSGSVCMTTSCSMTTPALGTPSAGVATNLTGLPLTTGVTGTLPVANGGTGITSLGTGVVTALGTAVSGTGAICLASGSSCAGGGGGNTTITPTSGNVADNAVCMQNTTTTIKDCGFAPQKASAVLIKTGNFTLTAAQWNANNTIQVTNTATETFPAVSTLSANGVQFLQNASSFAAITIQPNAADAVCVTNDSGGCLAVGVAAVLPDYYSAWITIDTNKIYVTPVSPMNVGKIEAGTTNQLPYYSASGNTLTAFSPGTGVFTAMGANLSANGGLTTTVRSGTSAMGTSAISSGACATAVTTSATGTATTDVISWGFNSDPTGVTGYAPVTTGHLRIVPYPTTNNVNFKVCNETSSSITPGAVTLNWRILR